VSSEGAYVIDTARDVLEFRQKIYYTHVSSSSFSSAVNTFRFSSTNQSHPDTQPLHPSTLSSKRQHCSFTHESKTLHRLGLPGGALLHTILLAFEFFPTRESSPPCSLLGSAPQRHSPLTLFWRPIHPKLIAKQPDLYYPPSSSVNPTSSVHRTANSPRWACKQQAMKASYSAITHLHPNP
jgi:hypothetical protein